MISRKITTGTKRRIAVASALAISMLTSGIGPAGASGEGAGREWCSQGGRPLPGAGPLEWKPVPKSEVKVAWSVGGARRSGSVLVLTGNKSHYGTDRSRLAALDIRTNRLHAFEQVLPPDAVPFAIAASPTAVYVVYGPYYKTLGRNQAVVRAFDLRTGAVLPRFHPTDFDHGEIFSIVYVEGKVVIAGYPAPGGGDNMVAYDAVTGARIWRARRAWSPTSMVADGSRLYVGVHGAVPKHGPLAAFDATDGNPVPGWGKSMAAGQVNGVVHGVDETRVFGSSSGAPVFRRFVVSRRNGRAVSLPHLPANGPKGWRAIRLFSGMSGTILGEIYRGDAFKGVNVDAVFDSSGKLIGTVCTRYKVLAQRDARHLIVVDPFRDRGRSTILTLARPR